MAEKKQYTENDVITSIVENKDHIRVKRVDPTKQIVTKSTIKLPNGKSVSVVHSVVDMDVNNALHIELSNAAELYMDAQDALYEAQRKYYSAQREVTRRMCKIVTGKDLY